jgi:hypothetical protein
MIHGAQEFCRKPRRDEGAYPQRSVTKEQRWMTVKGQADRVMFFLDGSLAWRCVDRIYKIFRIRHEKGLWGRVSE